MHCSRKAGKDDMLPTAKLFWRLIKFSRLQINKYLHIVQQFPQHAVKSATSHTVLYDQL